MEIYQVYLESIPEPLITLFDYFYWVWYFTQNEKWQEIQGIVQAVDDPGMTMSKTILVNSLYEIESWCTSIIVKMNDGQIIHSRNLDFANADGMRKITYQATFVKNGEYTFDAVMFAGVTGVYTGEKKGVFSISENQRRLSKNTDPKGLVENLFMMFYGYQEISWLIRKTFEHCDNYDCAYKNLRSQPINALGYIILAGTEDDQGVVLTRAHIKTAHEEHLNAT